MPYLRDLLYFDFEKASSIWSQLQWGHLKSFSVTSEEGKEQGVHANLGVPGIAEAGLKIGSGEKRTIIETRILHHDLLNRIEAFLSEYGLVVNLNAALPQDEKSPEKIRAVIGDTPYVVAKGRSVIEDYQRILLIAERFNNLASFISRSAIENLKQSEQYRALKEAVEESKRQLKNIKDRGQRALAKEQVKRLEEEIGQMLDSQIYEVDEWVLEGIKLWITTFLPKRINFRVYPFRECPAFQILCNLKRDSFVDQDLEHILYGYGTRPNVELSIFGLITSIPPKGEDAFDPLAEFHNLEELNEEMAFEHAMRNMFSAMEGFEGFTKYSRYPNITVHPIAVYREFLLPDKAAHNKAT